MNYLYNGVELPALPEWDREKYPYVVVLQHKTLGDHSTIISSIRPYEESGKLFETSIPYDFECYSHTTDGVWGEWTVSRGDWAPDLEYFTVTYTNVDIYSADGSVYAAAGTTTDPNVPEPPPDPVLPIPKGVTHCFYNGHKYAVLTEWNIFVYPYVFICEPDGDTHEVIATRAPSIWQTDYKLAHINNHYEHDTDSWGAWSSPDSSGSWNTVPIWSNHDIYTKGGVLQLAASDPVPIEDETATPDYAIIPTADYKAACDAIRAKTGKTDLIKSGDMATEIEGIVSEELKYLQEQYANVYLPTVTKLKKAAFIDDSTLETVSAPNLEEIGISAFNGCDSLASVDFPKLKIIGNGAFLHCFALASIKLPSVTTIGINAFVGCPFESLEFPSSLSYLGAKAFGGFECQTVTFKSTPQHMATDVFYEATIETLNVPWAEGEVAGAPWGARITTINYNCTGE